MKRLLLWGQVLLVAVCASLCVAAYAQPSPGPISEPSNGWEISIEVLVGLTSVLAAALGILLTSLFNLILKRIDFRNDYYKKIVDKRLDALKQIDLALKPFLLESVFQGKNLHSVVAEGYKDHENPASELLNMMKVNTRLHYAHRFNQYWVSQRTSNNLKNLIVYVSEHVDPRYELTVMLKNDREFCINRALAVYQPLKERVDEVYNSIQTEYAQLADVEGFLKQRGYMVTPSVKLVWNMLTGVLSTPGPAAVPPTRTDNPESPPSA